ncbi:MAG: hypothetical protein U1F76_23055 [Candidatus Competibacteraceae bacterium]
MGKARQRRLARRSQSLRRLSSRLLPVGASELTNARLATSFGFSSTQSMGFLVFETTLGEKTVYCCLAGGCLADDGTVWLTAIGHGALEALMSLPTGSGTLILQELKLGRTPLHDKIVKAVDAAPPGARICFFGDLTGELDGVAFKALNVQAVMSKVP